MNDEILGQILLYTVNSACGTTGGTIFVLFDALS